MEKKDTARSGNAYSDNHLPFGEKKKTNFIPKELLIATNAENLKSIVTSGLIRPKEAYAKYYEDLCQFSPGYIPIFVNKIPSEILSECQEEKDINVVIISLKLPWQDLLPCIRGYLDDQGKQFKGQPEDDTLVTAIYFGGVIPVSVIKAVYFKSKDQKTEFQSVRYSNFNHKIINSKVLLRPFKQQHANIHKDSLRFSYDDIERQIPHNKEYLESDARGGVISLLMQFLPPFHEAKTFVNLLVNNNTSSSMINFQVLPENLGVINNWIHRKPVSTDNVDKILLWHLLDLLASLNCRYGITSSEFLDDFQQQIESSNDFKQHPKYAYERLMERFKKSLDLMGDTLTVGDPSQFFQDPEITSGILRGLLLFLLYKSNISEFQKNNEYIKRWQITPTDILFVNVLYAAWKGWKNIDESMRPKDKKAIHSICNFISNWHNMNYMGRPYIIESEFSPELSGDFSPWAKTILLNSKWNRRLKTFAVELSRKRDWPCIQTEIKAENEKLVDFKLSKQGNVTLKLTGAVSIVETIDENDFKDKLKQTDLTDDEKKAFHKTFSG